MKINIISLTLAIVLSQLSCGTVSMQERRESVNSVIEYLNAGNLPAVEDSTTNIIGSDKGNPYARLLRAIGRYITLSMDLYGFIRNGIDELEDKDDFNVNLITGKLRETDQRLADIQDDLEVASRQGDISLPLSPSLWRFDWNQDGQTDGDDRAFLEVEYDGSGTEIPREDNRRRPVINFDHGDVYWAMAYIHFHRALVRSAMALDWNDVKSTLRTIDDTARISIKIKPAEVHRARDYVLQGLDCSGRARKAYLAETDDDREWIPNPNQKSTALPLPVTKELYEAWEGILSDLNMLAKGKEALKASDLVALAGLAVQPQWEPKGFFDVGAMFNNPGDINIELTKTMAFISIGYLDGFFEGIYGRFYVYEHKASRLPRRLIKMKHEIDSGMDTMEDKLRYLLWIN